VSSTLIDCYDTQAQPATYQSPSGSVKVTLGNAGFVNDCSSQTNRFNDDGSTATVSKLLLQAQENAQLWTNLLSASGGALEISKCSCHVIHYKFTVQGSPILVPEFPPDQVQLRVWDPNDNKRYTLPVMTVHRSGPQNSRASQGARRQSTGTILSTPG
jgi:hypothetical protein